MKNAVVGLPFSADRSAILLLHKTHPQWQRGRLNGPGGMVELGEVLVDAMVREFREETGIATARADWRLIASLKLEDGSGVRVLQVDVLVMFDDRIYEHQDTTDEHCEVFRVADLPTGALVQDLAWLLPVALSGRIRAPLQAVMDGGWVTPAPQHKQRARVPT